MTTFVQIAVNVPQVTSVFDYHVPPEMEGQIGRGQLVLVPFGRQTVQGIVLRETPAPAYETRAILEKVDEDAVLTPFQISLAEWLAQTTCATLSECMRLMLPPGLSKQADVLYSLNPIPVKSPNVVTLNETQDHILNLLRKRGALRGRQFDRALPKRN